MNWVSEPWLDGQQAQARRERGSVHIYTTIVSSIKQIVVCTVHNYNEVQNHGGVYMGAPRQYCLSAYLLPVCSCQFPPIRIYGTFGSEARPHPVNLFVFWRPKKTEYSHYSADKLGLSLTRVQGNPVLSKWLSSFSVRSSLRNFNFWLCYWLQI